MFLGELSLDGSVRIVKGVVPIALSAKEKNFKGIILPHDNRKETGVVEGILVRGETDYIRNRTKNCDEPKVCNNNSCRGEDVTRITNIKALMKI